MVRGERGVRLTAVAVGAVLAMTTGALVTSEPRSVPSLGRTVKYQLCPRVVLRAGTVLRPKSVGCSTPLRYQRTSLGPSVSPSASVKV